jgi:hypothetical protein
MCGAADDEAAWWQEGATAAHDAAQASSASGALACASAIAIATTARICQDMASSLPGIRQPFYDPTVSLRSVTAT